MNQNFLEAWVNCPHTVLGRRLKPFCLAHAVAFYVIDSPYTGIFDPDEGNRDVSLVDLELAVRICTTPFDRLLTSLNGGLWSVLWRITNRVLRHPEIEAKSFETYIKDYVACPETFTKEDHDGACGAPWPLSVGVLLSSKGNIPLEEAMTMPIGKAMWIAACLGEQGGAIDILSELEGSIVDEVIAHKKATGQI